MGKQKQKKSRSVLSANLFAVVFVHLIELHKEQEMFALNWVWNEAEVLKVFMKTVLEKPSCSRDVLRNGYHACRREQFHMFPESTWSKIDEIFLKKKLLSDMPEPVRKLVKVLRSKTQAELEALADDHQLIMDSDTSNSHTWHEVRKICPSSLEYMRDCFLGEWTIPAAQIFQPKLASVCRVFPKDYVFAETRGDLTYFYERKGDVVEIIVVHLKNALEFQAMVYLRSLLEQLFAAHATIIRQSMATLQSHMTGYGPFWQRFVKDGGTKVSFYTHGQKLSKVLKNLSSARDFEILADQYAHTHLTELILAIYMWKMPHLLKSFFNHSKPYLDKGDYAATDLEDILGGCRPAAYQLYITKDFYSEIHTDVDYSELTLSYCSHPDASSTTLVQFVMAEHGFRIGVGNIGSLFAFRSNVAHGTAYRNHTHNAAYMGCVVVNRGLHALTRRKQLL